MGRAAWTWSNSIGSPTNAVRDCPRDGVGVPNCKRHNRYVEPYRGNPTLRCHRSLRDGNSAKSNIIYGSSQDGIHTDDTCPPSTGSSNTVTGNTINEACAGILLGSGSGNTTAPNSFLNMTDTTLVGDTCAPLDGPSEKHQSLRPSAYKMKN
jgi:hypothetical protein